MIETWVALLLVLFAFSCGASAVFAWARVRGGPTEQDWNDVQSYVADLELAKRNLERRVVLAEVALGHEKLVTDRTIERLHEVYATLIPRAAPETARQGTNASNRDKHLQQLERAVTAAIPSSQGTARSSTLAWAIDQYDRAADDEKDDAVDSLTERISRGVTTATFFEGTDDSDEG